MGLFDSKKPQPKKRPSGQQKTVRSKNQPAKPKKRETLEAEVVDFSKKRPKSASSVKHTAKKRPTKPEPRKQGTTKRPSDTATKRPQPKNGAGVKNPRAVKAVKKPTAKNNTAKKKVKKRVNNPGAINSKIKTQSPTRRSATRMGKKVNGGIKNFEINRRPKQESLKFYVKKKKSPIKTGFRKRLSLFLVMFVLIFGIVALCFTLSLSSSASNKAFSLQIGKPVDEKDKTTQVTVTELPKGACNRYGERYIPMYLISDYCDLTVTGTSEQLKYSSRVLPGQNVRFNVDCAIAYVNGQKVLMKAPAFIFDGKLYVPVDFLKTYSVGITIEESESGDSLIVSKLITGLDNETNENTYSELSFKLSALSPCSSIAQTEDAEYPDDDNSRYDE